MGGAPDLAQLLMVAAMCSIRPLAAVALIPLFATANVPGAARNGFVLAIVAPVAWMQWQVAPPTDLSAASLLLLVVREGAIGVALGLGFAAFFAGLQAIGEIIDHQTGLTFSQNVDPVHGNQVSVTTQLLERVLFTALLAGGALLVIVDTIYLSFELWPIGKPLPQFESVVPLQLIANSGRLFAFALLLAGPVLFVLFAVEIAIGMLNRAAPQLNVFNVTLSLKSIVGLFVLMLALPLVTERTLSGFFELGRLLQGLLRAGI
jgi:type III secretion protein T